MLDNIINKIDTLPPLPQTIIEINEFRQNKHAEVENLIDILKKDPFLTTTLLKVANSSMFSFRSKVETLSRLVNLLGMKFTIYIAISETVQDILTTNLEPYCLTNDDLIKSSNQSIFIINNWIGKIDLNLKEELILPALLEKTGKLIISEIVSRNNLTQTFQKMIKDGNQIELVEQELVGVTSSMVTSKIFKHWKLSENLINIFQYLNDIENCKPEDLKKIQILQIVKILSSPYNSLSNENIEKALRKAQEYNLDTRLLKETIDSLIEKN